MVLSSMSLKNPPNVITQTKRYIYRLFLCRTAPAGQVCYLFELDHGWNRKIIIMTAISCWYRSFYTCGLISYGLVQYVFEKPSSKFLLVWNALFWMCDRSKKSLKSKLCSQFFFLVNLVKKTSETICFWTDFM